MLEDRNRFRRMDAETLACLESIVGPGRLLVDPDSIEKYSRDETEAMRAQPECAVRVESAQQVSEILRLANRKMFPVTPRTAGTGVTGGALPVMGGLVLSLESMNRIIDIDEANSFVVAEPGVITGVLQRAVEAKGLFYPPDPASLDSCAIGGNVAECAGGPRALKWGVTRNFVTGLEVVFPTGGIARLGGKLRKNVTGYDLIGLITGSEGTLAVVTEVTLRLVSKPQFSVDFLAPFRLFEDAVAAVGKITRSGDSPSVMEFMDHVCVRAARDFLGREMPFQDAQAQLLVQLTGRDDDDVSSELERVGGLCLEGGAYEVFVAQSASMRERIWEMRRKLREALLHRCPTKFAEDVSVPRTMIPELLARVREAGAAAGAEVACFGHIGDGNVHVNVLRGSLAENEWKARRPGLIGGVLRAAIAVGGTLSGEHGIGVTKRDYLEEALGIEALSAMRAIKAALDPNGILNPGKAI